MGSEPVLGVVREQAEHHLQAAPPCAQHGGAGIRVDLVGGQLGRDLLAGGGGIPGFLLRGADRAAGGGDRLVLGGGGGVRVGEQRGEGTLGGGQFLFRAVDQGVRGLAGGVAGAWCSSRWWRRSRRSCLCRSSRTRT